MGAIKGLDCRLYLNTSVAADARTNPTWSEWKCVNSAKLSIDFDAADSSCRGGGKWKQQTPTQGTLAVSGSAIKDKEDSAFLVASAAAINNTIVDVMVLDGDRAAPAGVGQSDGWRFDGQFSSFSENQDLTDVVKIDFELGVARTLNPPTQVSSPQ